MTAETNNPVDDSSMDGDSFVVLINEEGQYSIWPPAKPVPEGWSLVSPTSSPKSVCLAYISTNWTDMRPLSLRHAMDLDASKQMR
jgi:MbtH protein